MGLPALGLYELRCEKTCPRGFRPGPTQTRLLNHTRWLETGNFVFRKYRDCTIYVAKIKGADQLRGYRQADLRLCFLLMQKKNGFLTTRLILCLYKNINTFRHSLGSCKLNFIWNLLQPVGIDICINGVGHMTMMAAMPIYGRNHISQLGERLTLDGKVESSVLTRGVMLSPLARHFIPIA